MVVSSKILNSIKQDKQYVYTLQLHILKQILEYADDKYYNDTKPIFTDEEYDHIKEYVLIQDPTYIKVGATEIHAPVKLPVWMGSMDKKKTFVERENIIVSDKLDGVSCLIVKKNEKISMYTRGNGEYGKDITHLIEYINNIDSTYDIDYIVRGELILPKDVFASIKSNESNARNTVSGFVNSKKPKTKFKNKIDFVAYEVLEPSNKTPMEQMRFLENTKFKKVFNEYYNTITTKIAHQILIERKNTSSYEIDGIIITSNDKYELPKSGNPKHAFAYKHNFDEHAKETTVTNVKWNVSKNGYLKPVVQFSKICINDIHIQQATGFNAKYIYDNKIGKGSKILIQRSGDVIPYIVSVLNHTHPDMPSVPYKWNPSGIDIKISEDNETFSKKRFENMIVNLKINGLGVRTIHKLYDNDIRTIKDIYTLTPDKIKDLEGYQDISAKKLYTNIQTRKDDITCIEYMIASNCFDEGIGEKVLEKITSIYGDTEVDIEKLLKIDNIGESRAKSYMSGLRAFKLFLKTNELECIFHNENSKSNTFENKMFVFTGFRDKDLENFIIAHGGKIQKQNVTKNTYMVIYKNLDNYSKKLEDAKKYKILIYSIDEFKTSNNI